MTCKAKGKGDPYTGGEKATGELYLQRGPNSELKIQRRETAVTIIDF